MLANRDMAVEAAKKMVSMQFNLADGLSGMDIGNAGYLYETDSSNEFENNLVEIEGTYAGAGKESGTVLLKSENKKNTLVMVKETVYSRSITSNKSIATGEKLYVIAVKAEGCSVYVPVVVLRDSEKEYFMMVKSLYGRTIAIKDFYKLSVEEQESIMVQTKTGHHKRYSSGEELFTSKKNQMLRYALTKETYPPDTQHAVYNGVYIKGQYLAAFLYLWKYMAAWAVLYLEYEILGIRNRLSMVLIAGFFSRYLVRMIVTGKPEIMMFTGDIIFWFVSFVLYVIVWWNEDEISTN